MTDHPIRAGLDAGAILTGVGALIGWLPHLAALFPIIYYAFLIWETKTVRDWRKRRRR